MRYRVRLWCSDCTGEDPQGCFDGDTQLLSDDAPPFDVRLFATLREAVDAGYDATDGNAAPREFDVETESGDEIEWRTMTDPKIDAYDMMPSTPAQNSATAD